jgi:membrane-associated phospholipid phosphatase
VALCVVFPPLGVIAVLESVSVGWACAYCRAHWLSDISVAGGIGVAYGLLLGTAHWRIERRRALAG